MFREKQKKKKDSYIYIDSQTDKYIIDNIICRELQKG